MTDKRTKREIITGFGFRTLKAIEVLMQLRRPEVLLMEVEVKSIIKRAKDQQRRRPITDNRLRRRALYGEL